MVIEGQSTAVQTMTWTCDGNRLTENGTQSTFDAQDRLLTKGTTTYTWDALGGRKTKTEGGQTTQYTHDGLGALLSVTLPDSTAVTYEYDAPQRRVAKRRNGTVEARWVYDGQYRVAAQLDASGTVTYRFVYGSQSHSPDYVVKGGVTYTYVKNHLGSIRFVLDSTNGVVAQQLDYDAWGNVLSDSAPGFQPFAFAGGIYDRDTKLTHFGYRDYDVTSGTWTSKDPIRLRGGNNVFLYAGGAPTQLIDFNGLDVWIEGPSGGEVRFHQSICVGAVGGDNSCYSYGLNDSFDGQVYLDEDSGGEIQKYAKTTPEQDAHAHWLITSTMSIDNASHSYLGDAYVCRDYVSDKWNLLTAKEGVVSSKPPEVRDSESICGAMVGRYYFSSFYDCSCDVDTH